jgi:predicted O-linked N-acetylglucosamine transferase (SPINDLY family)
MQQTFQRAVQYHQAGRLAEAESLYRQLLNMQPNNAQVLHLLGLAAYQRGDTATAAVEIGKAVALAPNQPDYFSNLGLALRANHQQQQAVEAYRKALQLAPRDAAVHNNLGSALHDLKLFDEAETSYRTSLALEAQNPSALFNLGNLLSDAARHAEAVQCYRQALRFTPQDADIHNNLANALRESGQLEPALASYREALRLQPGYPAAARHAGWLLQELGRPSEAIAFYHEALRHNPNDDAAHFNLGNALRDAGNFTEAVRYFREAIRLNPNDAEMHNNLGNALRELGQLQGAIACYRQALIVDPALHHARAHLLHQCQQACDWEGLDILAAEVRRLVREVPEAQIPPFAFLAVPGVTAAEQRRCAENWVAGQYGKYVPIRERLNFSFKRAAKPKIRLGYLSADFHEHATAYLMAEVFELHDREHFEVIAYSYGPDDGSAMRARLTKAFDRFEDVRALTTENAARKIHADGIDILIDLKGYTAHTRSEILALRPAPVQVNYLGYPGTMGADFVDYLIGDAIATPSEQAAEYSEKLALMPYSYQSNDRHRPIPPKPGRVECGLPEQGFVFCGFNQTFKILPEMFDLWMRLLREVPGSVLWLLQSNELAAANLRQEAQARGVDGNRLIFAPRLPQAEHLARQQQADLLLDTLPYNAHTTASDALWTGVPVVTCMGETFAARVAASLLHAVDLPELITQTLDDYAALALKLAREPATLQGFKDKLIANRATAPLFDTERFTRDLEAQYQTMWKDYLDTCR